MVNMRKIVLGLLALSPFAQAAKPVYAHFMVRSTYHFKIPY